MEVLLHVIGDISEDERHENNSTMWKIVEYFNSLTKQIDYHEKKIKYLTEY